MCDKPSVFVDRRLTVEEASVLLGKTPKTLREWRHKGIGPRYIDDGTIGYWESVCYQWNRDHEVGSTAEAQARKRGEAWAKQAKANSKVAPLSAGPDQRHSPATGRPSSAAPRRRRLYHRMTNWEREVIEKARAAEQQAP